MDPFPVFDYQTDEREFEEATLREWLDLDRATAAMDDNDNDNDKENDDEGEDDYSKSLVEKRIRMNNSTNDPPSVRNMKVQSSLRNDTGSSDFGIQDAFNNLTNVHSPAHLIDPHQPLMANFENEQNENKYFYRIKNEDENEFGTRSDHHLIQRSIMNPHQQDHHNHPGRTLLEEDQVLSLDPSMIMGELEQSILSSSTLNQSSNLYLNNENLVDRNESQQSDSNSPQRLLDQDRSYSNYDLLDPLLLSASLPTHQPTPQPKEKAEVDHKDFEFFKIDETQNKKPTIDRSYESPETPSCVDEHMRSPTRSSHSRSSSAVVPQPPQTTLPRASHKRTSSHPHALVDVPDWDDKPTPEEYKLLSSKEKRQLRNKISARNFRHRRKEHITTLEQQVAQRDETIESMSHELGLVRLENKQLRTEVESLKGKWSDLMKKIEEMSLGASPAPPSSVFNQNQPGATSNQPSPQSSIGPISPRLRPSTKPNAMLTMPNLHKDLGSHSRKPFNGAGTVTGGNVGVHTTLIPEVAVNLYRPRPKRVVRDITDLIPRKVQEVLSPQALIEFKQGAMKQIGSLRTEKRACEFEEGEGLNLLESYLSRMVIGEVEIGLSKLSLTDDLGEIEDEKSLGKRLSEMLIESLLTKDGYDGEEYDDKMTMIMNRKRIDREKLRGLLEGRLTLSVNESFPPAYDYENCYEKSYNDNSSDLEKVFDQQQQQRQQSPQNQSNIIRVEA